MILTNNTLFISVLPFFSSALSVHNKLFLEANKKYDNCFFVVNKYGDSKIKCKMSDNKDVIAFPFYSKKNLFYPFFSNLGHFIKSTWKLKTFIKAHKIETIYTSNEVRNVFYAVILSKLTGCKVTIHVHLDISNLDKLRIFFIKRLLPNVQKLVFCSKKIMSLVQNKYDISSKENVLLYNTVDIKKYAPDEIASENCWEKELKLGFVGRISKDKGVDVLVSPLFQKFLKDNKLTITIVGAGSNKYENKIKDSISNINKNCYCFAGPRNDVDKLLKTFDILIIPSKCEENCSLVLLEGMASGCTVIASNRGGNPEILADTGLLFNESKPEELVSIIENLIKNKDKLSSYKLKARERIVSNFSDEVLKCYI